MKRASNYFWYGWLLAWLPSLAGAQTTGQPLPPWQLGQLEIHFIHTGRGNCAYYLFPDGTTMLVDAGEQDPTDPRTLSPRNTALVPDSSRRPYEWIADYIRSRTPAGRQPGLDYALVTHYHADHYGTVYLGAPVARNGAYVLTGMVGVGDLVPIHQLIDRGSHYPTDLRSPQVKVRLASLPGGSRGYASLENYWKFSEYWQKAGKLKHQALQVGKSDQIRLLVTPQHYPNFRVTGLYANGDVWTGREVRHIFPDLSKAQPGENQSSCAIKLSYGKFDFFTAGDISGIADLGTPEWYDVESAIAPYIGEVDVMTVNHHGNRDGTNVQYLRTLKPRVIVQEVWSSDHPGHEVLRRLTSKWVYPEERDLFATNMLEANKQVIGPELTNAYRSYEGHVVIRVEPGGEQYHVYVLNHRNQQRELLKTFGPYLSK
jgi:hypothetical protein